MGKHTYVVDFVIIRRAVIKAQSMDEAQGIIETGGPNLQDKGLSELGTQVLSVKRVKKH